MIEASFSSGGAKATFCWRSNWTVRRRANTISTSASPTACTLSTRRYEYKSIFFFAPFAVYAKLIHGYTFIMGLFPTILLVYCSLINGGWENISK